MAPGDSELDGLIRLARRGDREAADRLWAIVRPRLAERGDTSPEASDVIQDTLLYASQELTRFRGSTEPELLAWLRRIRDHKAVDAGRRGAAKKRGSGRAPRSLDDPRADGGGLRG